MAVIVIHMKQFSDRAEREGRVGQVCLNILRNFPQSGFAFICPAFGDLGGKAGQKGAGLMPEILAGRLKQDLDKGIAGIGKQII